MRHFKKIIFFIFMVVLSLGASIFALDFATRGQAGVSRLSHAIELIKLRTKHPTMSAENLEREATKNDRGLLELVKTIGGGKIGSAAGETNPTDRTTTSGKSHEDGDVYVRVAENQDALFKSQLKDGADTDIKEIKGAVREIETGVKVAVEKTADGRDVLGVVHGLGTEDLNAIDRINKLNIPEHMKQRILRNYEATGELPEIVVREQRRKPSTTSEN